MPCFLKKFLFGKVLNFSSLGGRLARVPECNTILLLSSEKYILRVGIGVAGMVV